MRSWVFKTIQKFKSTKFYKWHRDFLIEIEQNNAAVITSVWTALFFGSILDTSKLLMLGVGVYIVEFMRWTIFNAEEKEYIQMEPPWEQEGYYGENN